MQWTSLESFESLIPDLSTRCHEALEYLLTFIHSMGYCPTGEELAEFSREDGYPSHKDIARRLCDLSDKYSACYRGPVRVSKVGPGKNCFTWVPGPGPDGVLGKPRKSELIDRYRVLRLYAPKISKDEMAMILGVSLTTLRIAIKRFVNWRQQSTDPAIAERRI